MRRPLPSFGVHYGSTLERRYGLGERIRDSRCSCRDLMMEGRVRGMGGWD